jgi:hypothetical protein
LIDGLVAPVCCEGKNNRKHANSLFHRLYSQERLTGACSNPPLVSRKCMIQLRCKQQAIVLHLRMSKKAEVVGPFDEETARARPAKDRSLPRRGNWETRRDPVCESNRKTRFVADSWP